MQVIVDGEASIENDVWFTVDYYWGSGSTTLASTYIPTLQGSTTKIDVQPPIIYVNGSPTEFRLRLNFYANKWGASFTLRKVQLHAINECGEGLYDTFSVDTEANKYAASTTSSMDWKVSTQMSSNVPFRTVADSSFVQSQKFSTKDQGAWFLVIFFFLIDFVVVVAGRCRDRADMLACVSSFSLRQRRALNKQLQY